jgi:D-alanyl-lipoteichoic acid acyltransferase DltB (MBOAT superfamily)
VADGLWLVFWGYVLKVFVADNLAPLVDGVFDAPSAPTGLATLVAVYAFAFQIFGDFAGYSSIAVGVARMMGFELSTNFLFPYFVTNPRDFWRNWHVSLSTWLRDYLYIPLGGNRGTRTRVSRNLLLTMLLGGLWHGAAWSFVLWGAYQGALLIGHRWIDTLGSPIASRLPPALERPWRVAKVVGMFHLTCLGWLIFRSTSVARVGSMLKAVLTAPGPLSHAVVLSMLQLVFFTWLMLAVQLLMRRSPDIARIDGVPEPARVGILAAMLYSLVVWGSYGGTELIYFQF